MIQATVHTCFQALMLEGFGGAGAAQELGHMQFYSLEKDFLLPGTYLPEIPGKPIYYGVRCISLSVD